MKIVIKKSTNLEVYSQEPDFQTGLGLSNAVAMYGGVESDYEEITVTAEERKLYNSNNKKVSPLVSSYKPIVGCTNTTTLSTVTLVSLRHYYVPFISDIDLSISTLKIGVTNSKSCNVRLGVYDNTLDEDSDCPGHLLVTSGDMSTSSIGEITSSCSLDLLCNTIYWFCLSVGCASSSPTVRALALNSIRPLLGWLSNSSNAVTYLYYTSASNILMDPAPSCSLLTVGTGVIPAIYYY